jgi:HD-GYP domain-containing protein (c-di-GMP phosphodiesterase class II)
VLLPSWICNQPQPRVRAVVWWALCLATPVLLVLGVIGIFRLFSWAATQAAVTQAQLFDGLFLAVLPIMLFAFFSAALLIHYIRQQAHSANAVALAGSKSRQSYQQDFVRMIADNRPGATSIVDGAGRLWFVNAHAARNQTIAPQDMVGMAFDKVFGESDTLRLLPLMQQARTTGQVVEAINQVRTPNGVGYIKSQIIPLPATANMQAAVMINEDDVTSVLVEREARERMFRQLIDTLVAVVDRRDPFATGHSVRVGQLARAVAAHLRCEPMLIETAEIAGLLMNFGKVLVPRAILVKTSALTPDELQQVHASMLSSADILALIGFPQPVVPTLRQVLAHYDGSGTPAGLAGEAIILPARIVAVANTFVALLSARAHRPGMSVTGALDMLNQHAGKTYDGRVIEALTSYLAAEGHRLEWLSMPTAATA